MITMMSTEEMESLEKEARETIDTDRLHELAMCGNPFVLDEVVTNKNTTADTLHYIIHKANGADGTVRYRLLFHSNLKESDMWHQLHNFHGRELIAHNPNATSEMLQHLAEIGDLRCKEVVVKHKNTSRDTLAYLSKKGEYRVSVAIIESYRATEEMLLFLIDNSEDDNIIDKALERLREMMIKTLKE